MDKLSVPGCPTVWMIGGQGLTALTVGAGSLVWTFFSHLSFLSSLWDMARYRLKYCLKGLLNPKQPTNQYQQAASHNSHKK